MSEKIKSLAGRKPTTDGDWAERMEKSDWYLRGGWEEVKDTVPSIAGLACFLGITRETVYAWRRTNQEFSDMCNAILVCQERVLLNRGLDGSFNPQITKLVLAKHSYSEKVEVDNTSSDGSTNPNKIVIVAGKGKSSADGAD